MTRLLFAILSLTIITQSALAQFAADSGKETRNSVVFQNPAETAGIRPFSETAASAKTANAAK